MVKMMSRNNLVRGFLLSTLVWTLPINFELETLAQVEIVQSPDITQKEEKRQDYKKLLQKTNELYEKAEKFSQSVDQLNIELQEEFDLTKKLNNINLKPVLAQKKEFNKIWQEFDKELETQSELAKFPKKKEIVKTISSLEALLSALDSSVKKPSSPRIAKLQEQLFTSEEIKSNFDKDRVFDTKTLNKFALDSTNEVRDLRLQVAQIEKHIYIQFLYLQQQGNFVLDTQPESNGLFSFKAFLVFAFLSGCTLLIMMKAYKQNHALKKRKYNQNHQKSYSNNVNGSQTNRKQRNRFLESTGNVESTNRKKTTSQIPTYNQANYNQAKVAKNPQSLSRNKASRTTNNHKTSERIPTFSNKAINKNGRDQSYNSSYSSPKQTKPSLNSQGRTTNNVFSQTTEKPALAKSNSPAKYVSETVEQPNTLDQEIIRIYQQSPRELAKKSIKVAATRESIEQRRAGIKTPILFTETGNDSYWIYNNSTEDNCFYLVPKANLVINSLIYQTIKDVFICQGYQNRTSNKFKLERSAVVQSEDSGSWKLIKAGELVFS